MKARPHFPDTVTFAAPVLEQESGPAPIRPRRLAVPPARAARVLDFDIENRPLSYWYPGATTAEVTVIAWCWTDTPDAIECEYLRSGRDGPTGAKRMLRRFTAAWSAADMVTGHNIRRHDLGILQAALIERELPRLRGQLVQDTYGDLKRFRELPKSQKDLAELFGVEEPKLDMSQHRWRSANRLEQAGVDRARRRCVMDVAQHMALRAELLRRELLNAPKRWRP